MKDNLTLIFIFKVNTLKSYTLKYDIFHVNFVLKNILFEADFLLFGTGSTWSRMQARNPIRIRMFCFLLHVQ